MNDTRPSRSGSIALFAAGALACIVAGFLVGWFVRGSGGDVAVLPPVSAPATSTSQHATTTTATTATPAAPELPKPADIKLAVLNGTTIAGFAAKTAGRAQGLGYPAPTAGNTPTTTDPTTVYFREGKRPAAQRVAKDLGFTTIKALPTSGAVATSAPATADVVVVLGATGT